MTERKSACAAQKATICATPGCGKRLKPHRGAGRPAKRCKDHQKPRGKERDPVGNRERFNARRRAKHGGAAPAPQMMRAWRLAAGLSVLEDPRRAAELVGLDVEEQELAELVGFARTLYAGVISADPATFGRLNLAAMHLVTMGVLEGLSAIAPRDLPHVERALAQSRDMVAGKQPVTQYTQATFYVIGADGKVFNPLEVPQGPATTPQAA